MEDVTFKMLAEPLRRTQLFAGASDAVIAKLAATTVRKVYKKNDVIVHEGDDGDRMFLLLEGRARVMVAAAGDGTNITLTTLGPSDSFGELSLLDGLPRSATVQALDSPTVVFALTRDLFLEVIHGDPGLTETLLKTLSVTLKRLTARASDSALIDVRQRTARYLVHSCLSNAQPGAAIDLTRKTVESELSNVLGRPTEQIAEVLASFDEMGAIKLDPTRVTVLDEPVLREVALGLV